MTGSVIPRSRVGLPICSDSWAHKETSMQFRLAPDCIEFCRSRGDGNPGLCAATIVRRRWSARPPAHRKRPARRPAAVTGVLCCTRQRRPSRVSVAGSGRVKTCQRKLSAHRSANSLPSASSFTPSSKVGRTRRSEVRRIPRRVSENASCNFLRRLECSTLTEQRSTRSRRSASSNSRLHATPSFSKTIVPTFCGPSSQHTRPSCSR